MYLKNNIEVEKHCLRFYKYKLLGFEDKPIIIEAYNKREARQKLIYIREKLPHLQNIPVVNESLSLPIYGETTKMINNVKHVWVGYKKYQTEWMKLEDFIKKEIL